MTTKTPIPCYYLSVKFKNPDQTPNLHVKFQLENGQFYFPDAEKQYRASSAHREVVLQADQSSARMTAKSIDSLPFTIIEESQTTTLSAQSFNTSKDKNGEWQTISTITPSDNQPGTHIKVELTASEALHPQTQVFNITPTTISCPPQPTTSRTITVITQTNGDIDGCIIL